jgi:hypothetical protein
LWQPSACTDTSLDVPIAVGAVVKASAAAAVMTHLSKRRDAIQMATASITYVFHLRAVSWPSWSTNTIHPIRR